MPEILVVADDLTGAADCGLAFAAQGFATSVTLGDSGDVPDDGALAVDADSRARSEEEAAQETARLVARLAPSCRALFKKTDSTLRGHVGAEIAAALGAWRSAVGSGLVVMTPAFPALGRTVREGRLFVHGTPFGEAGPAPGSARLGGAHVPRLLTDAGMRTAVVGLDEIRSDPRRLPALMAARAEGRDALACDAETDDDLRAIVTGARTLARSLVWAGSAGLARPLAEVMSEGRARRAPVAAPAAGGPILFVVGSASPVSREQAAALAAAPGMTLVSVASGAGSWDEPGLRVANALAHRRDVVLSIDAPRSSAEVDRRSLAAALGRLVAAHGRHAGALVLTGGETARTVLEAIGVGVLRVVTQVEPGVPLLATEGAVRMPLITKAGAFGDGETLLRCRAALRQEKRERTTNASA